MSDPAVWVPSESERTGRGPTARKAWGAFGCGLAGAFFLGLLVTGSAGERFIAVIIGMPIFLLAGAGLLAGMGERVKIGVLPRLALYGFSVGAGFQIARALDYEVTGPPPQDLGLALSSTYGISGLILLGLAVATALWFSLHRFPLAATPEPEHPPSTDAGPA